MAWDKKVPYDSEGNLMHFPYVYSHDLPIDWREAKEFSADMTYTGYSRGRSAANLHFEDAYGVKYTMFMSDFDKIMGLVDHGKMSGTFKEVKRGQNYGISFVESK